ncbi:MAG TPA: tetratricopeptide repeat protein [Lacipirellulaceae bacterium]
MSWIAARFALVRCLTNLARVRNTLGRHEEAEPLLLQAVEMASRILPEDHEYRRLAIEKLEDLREARQHVSDDSGAGL